MERQSESQNNPRDRFRERENSEEISERREKLDKLRNERKPTVKFRN